MTERQWWKEAVVYQIYPRSFKDSTGNGIGDINGIIEKLDYIKDLGVDVIWLNPIYDSPNDDNGYDIRNYKEIHSEFGTMADWERLLEEMHKRDLKLIMDLVVNHTSDEHEWFIQSKSSKDNPYRDYYHWIETEDGEEPNSNISFFSGTVWDKTPETDEYYLHIFSKKQPDLNWENPNVREEVYSMMKWWLDKGIDGFRMDVINFISKHPETFKIEKGLCENKYANGPKVHEYLHEMNKRVLSNYDIMTVGECPGTTPEIASEYVNEDREELQMLFNFEHMKVDYSDTGDKWILGEDLVFKLKRVLSKWQTELHEKCWNSIYLMNHDQPRAVSRFGTDDEHLRPLAAKMLVTMNMTLKGTPYIYMGEEIGMTNADFNHIDEYRDIETLNFYKEAVSEGRNPEELMEVIKVKSRDNSRTPMQWSSEEGAGFTTGTPWINFPNNFKQINVENELKSKDSILSYYQEVIRLRKTHLGLIYGDFIELDPDNPDVFCYKRVTEDSEYFVVLNMVESTSRTGVLDIDINMKDQIISNYSTDYMMEDGIITLAPYEVRVFKIK